MDEESQSDQLLSFCMELSNEDCQEIFSSSRNSSSKYNPRKVVKSMSSDDSIRCDFQSFSDKLYQLAGKQVAYEEIVLNVLAHEPRKLLHAFLVALKKENEDCYTEIEQNIRRVIYRKPCELVLPYTERDPNVRAELVKDLTENDRRLLVCPACEEMMCYPMLLPCLHSCCRECIEPSCARCHESVNEPVPNYFLHLKLADVASKSAIRQNSINSERHQSSGERFIPMCKTHGTELMRWCSGCKDYRCQVYASRECNLQNPAHKLLLPQVEIKADDVQYEFESCAFDPTETKKVMEKQFEQTLLVLEKNNSRFTEAGNEALRNAVEEHQKLRSAILKILNGLTERWKQARLYVRSVRDECWDFVHQHERLLSQLECLRSLTEQSNRSLTSQHYPSFGVTDDNEVSQSSGIVPSLIIRNLEKNYNLVDIARNVIGQPELATPDTCLHNDGVLLLEEPKKEHEEAIAELSNMVVDQYNEDVNEDQQVKHSVITSKCNGYVHARRFDDVCSFNDSAPCELHSQLRSHTDTLTGRLKAVNVHTLATKMWAAKCLNDRERSDIMCCNEDYASAEKVLSYIYKRPCDGIVKFARALRDLDMTDLADYLQYEERRMCD